MMQSILPAAFGLLLTCAPLASATARWVKTSHAMATCKVNTYKYESSMPAYWNKDRVIYPVLDALAGYDACEKGYPVVLYDDDDLHFDKWLYAMAQAYASVHVDCETQVGGTESGAAGACAHGYQTAYAQTELVISIAAEAFIDVEVCGCKLTETAIAALFEKIKATASAEVFAGVCSKGNGSALVDSYASVLSEIFSTASLKAMWEYVIVASEHGCHIDATVSANATIESDAKVTPYAEVTLEAYGGGSSIGGAYSYGEVKPQDYLCYQPHANLYWAYPKQLPITCTPAKATACCVATLYRTDAETLARCPCQFPKPIKLSQYNVDVSVCYANLPPAGLPECNPDTIDGGDPVTDYAYDFDVAPKY